MHLDQAGLSEERLQHDRDHFHLNGVRVIGYKEAAVAGNGASSFLADVKESTTCDTVYDPSAEIRKVLVLPSH